MAAATLQRSLFCADAGNVMIRAENLSKSFGGRVLFDRVDFTLNSRERLGLVGRNGHGKTTLFRIIAGEEPPDDGGLIIPKHYRIGYVRQTLEFHAPDDPGRGHDGAPAPGERPPLEGRKDPGRPGLFQAGHGPPAGRVLGRLPGAPQPRQGPGLRARPAAARRAHQFPRHHLHPLDRALPGGLAPGAHGHHPRPQLHGQGGHPRHGHPPPEGPQDRRHHRRLLRPDRPGRGGVRKDAAQRRAPAQGGGAVHHSLPRQGAAGRAGAVPGQDPAEDGEAGQAGKAEGPRVLLPGKAAARQVRPAGPPPWGSPTSRTSR